MVTIKEVTLDEADDLGTLFGSAGDADRCWCMWFITSVREFHAAGRAGNREGLLRLIDESQVPVGLLAYDGQDPVGRRNRHREFSAGRRLGTVGRIGPHDRSGTAVRRKRLRTGSSTVQEQRRDAAGPVATKPGPPLAWNHQNILPVIGYR